jgi:hypothetical protein
VTSTPALVRFAYSPLRVRLNQAWIGGMTCLTPGAITAAAVSGWLRPAIVVITALATLWAVRRGFRLALVATPRTILIRNYWRSHTVDWDRVTDVFVGSKMMGILPQPAFAFRLQDGRTVAAQATPFKADPQTDLLHELAKLAPPHVQFHWP